jgi:hypothetical protein
MGTTSLLMGNETMDRILELHFSGMLAKEIGLELDIVETRILHELNALLNAWALEHFNNHHNYRPRIKRRARIVHS